MSCLLVSEPMGKDSEPPKQPDLPAAARQPSAMLGWSPFDAIVGGWAGRGRRCRA
jgi:hypothetical protein